jgi:GNAT superfamily N-acetyltransferase
VPDAFSAQPNGKMRRCFGSMPAPANPPPATAEPPRLVVASAKHRNFVLDLQRRFSNQLGFLPAQAIDEYIAARRICLALENGEPAGYVLARPNLASLPGVASCVQTAICFDAQRRKLATALIDRTANAALGAGAHLLQAWCRADLEANGFWEAAGFNAVALRRTGNARRRPLLLWRRALDAHGETALLHLPGRAGCTGRRISNARLLTANDRLLLSRPNAA